MPRNIQVFTSHHHAVRVTPGEDRTFSIQDLRDGLDILTEAVGRVFGETPPDSLFRVYLSFETQNNQPQFFIEAHPSAWEKEEPK